MLKFTFIDVPPSEDNQEMELMINNEWYLQLWVSLVAQMGAFHSANISKREESTMNGTEMSRTCPKGKWVQMPWENSHVMHSHWNANLQPLNCYDWLKTFFNTLTQHSCIEHFETITWLHLNTIGSLNICRMNISLVSLSLYQVRCATTSKSKRELHGSMQPTPHIKCQRHRE